VLVLGARELYIPVIDQVLERPHELLIEEFHWCGENGLTVFSLYDSHLIFANCQVASQLMLSFQMLIIVTAIRQFQNWVL
jgi:hypothetical protein